MKINSNEVHATVIQIYIKQLLNDETPVINGDGN
jgi:hypothetical protein